MNQPSARANERDKEPKAPDGFVEAVEALQYKESTYFWHGEHDMEVCRAYVREKYPGSKARVVSMINMHRLHERSAIICLSRKRPSPNEKFAIELGRRMSVPVDPMTQLKEVSESPPVLVKTFISGGTEWEDGALDAAALIDKCARGNEDGKSGFAPSVCHYRADDGRATLMGA